MGSNPNSHARAVAAFAALSGAAEQGGIDGPAALSRAAGLPPSSGHRAAAQAEASGLLLRNTEGLYRAGPTAIRIGLSALGFGDLSYVAEPILVETRQSVGLTACLAIGASGALTIGPWSTGRGRDYVRPCQRYAWPGDPVAGGPVTRTLACDGDPDRRHRLRLVPLCDRAGRWAYLGVLLAAQMPRLADTEDQALCAAARRFPVGTG